MGSKLQCPQCKAILDVDAPDAEPPASCPECGHEFNVTVGTPLAAAAPPADPALRFETTPYRPDGGFSMAGSGILIGLSMLAAVALGWLVTLIEQWVYLILIFPLAIGALVGVVGMVGIKLGKVRSPALAGLAGILAGCVAMLSMHYFDYLAFRAEVDRDIPPDQQAVIEAMGPDQIRALPKQIQEQFLEERRAVRVKSFPAYMDYQATNGVTIQRVGHGGANDRGTNLGYIGSLIYWGVEVLIVAVVAFVIMMGAAGQPFCRECQAWKQQRKLGTLTFRPGDVGAAQLVSALGSGEVTRLIDYNPSPGDGPLHLSASVCPKCRDQGPIDVKLLHKYKTAKNEERSKELLHVTYPGEAFRALEAVFQVTPPVIPPAPARGGEPSK
jgi:hypothetical protein